MEIEHSEEQNIYGVIVKDPGSEIREKRILPESEKSLKKVHILALLLSFVPVDN